MIENSTYETNYLGTFEKHEFALYFSNPQRLNRFAYVQNNPINFNDPLGLAAAEGAAAVGAATSSSGFFSWLGSALSGLFEGIWAAPAAFFATLFYQQTCDAPAPEANNNPYKGPVDDGVIVVDENGNAIPVKSGEKIEGSDNGEWVDVKNSRGDSTGIQIHGAHNPTTHANYPEGLVPHVHRGDVPGTDHFLPLK